MKAIKKEGLLKRLKNIEGKNEQQLEAIKGGLQLQTIKNKCLKLVDQKDMINSN